jgi:hypothetical protein
MLRSGPSTLPCPQLTSQKVWHTLQSHSALGPGEAGPGCPHWGMWAPLDCPGHQVYGPSGRAWAVPAPGPKVASPRPPDTNTVVANPTIPRFINLGLFPAAASRVLGIRLNRDDRFMLVPLVAVGPWSALQQVDTARRYRSQHPPPGGPRAIRRFKLTHYPTLGSVAARSVLACADGPDEPGIFGEPGWRSQHWLLDL